MAFMKILIWKFEILRFVLSMDLNEMKMMKLIIREVEELIESKKC